MKGGFLKIFIYFALESHKGSPYISFVRHDNNLFISTEEDLAGGRTDEDVPYKF